MISVHILGMYGLVLIVGGVYRPLRPAAGDRRRPRGDDGSRTRPSSGSAALPGMSIALLGLGLGWCFSYVAATTELIPAVLAPPARRPRRLHRSLREPRRGDARSPRRPRLHGRRGRLPRPLRCRPRGSAGPLACLPAAGVAAPGGGVKAFSRVSLQSRPGGHPWSAAFAVMKTYSAKPGEITREWYLVDADGLTLGRLATVTSPTRCAGSASRSSRRTSTPATAWSS